MSSLREAAQQALAYIEQVDYGPYDARPVITALRAALAEPQTTHWQGCEEVHPECRKPEPVAWRNKETGEFCTGGFLRKDWARWTPLYTAPTPRKPLTDEQVRDLWSWSMTPEAERTATTQQHAFARAIEKAHGITGGSDE